MRIPLEDVVVGQVITMDCGCRGLAVEKASVLGSITEVGLRLFVECQKPYHECQVYGGYKGRASHEDPYVRDVAFTPTPYVLLDPLLEELIHDH